MYHWLLPRPLLLTLADICGTRGMKSERLEARNCNALAELCEVLRVEA
jgi:hypothetical protein